MSRRLKTIAKELEATYPELRVTLEKWRSSTDRHLSGTRFRHAGKGRIGTRFSVYYRLDPIAQHEALDAVQATFHGLDSSVIRGAEPLFDHRAGDTYRNNTEVEEWAKKYAACKREEHRKLFREMMEPDLCCICRRVRVL